MEGIHSYEQRSTSEIGHEFDLKQNRLIIVNRREPDASWATPNQPVESRYFAWTNWFSCRLSPSCCSSSTRRRTVSSVAGAKVPLGKPDLIGGAMAASLSSASTLSAARFHAGPFPSNEWRTSKYTLISFLPKNLFEQFRRLANFYFLITAILQCVLPLSPVSPATSVLPLVFVVSTTAIKQAYEDYLRHKLDDEMNNRTCHVLRGKKLVKIRSKDIRVGDFVHVKNNEEIPCDMILLASSCAPVHDRCYVTTANLDGETSLKSRSCFQILEKLGSIEQLDDTLLVVECERPNATLYEFNGYLRAPKSGKSYDYLVKSLIPGPKPTDSNYKRSHVCSLRLNPSIIYTIMRRIRHSRRIATPPNTTAPQVGKRASKSAEKSAQKQHKNQPDKSVPEIHEIPLDISNLLLRASRLRNTSYIYGLVVYTGRDTKLAHNSHVKANKFSSTESRVNIFLLLSFLLLIILSVVGALRYKRPKGWFYEGFEKSDSIEQILIAHFLLYNYLVPISLYVTLEFVKFFGTMSVVDDKNMKVTVLQTTSSEAMKSSGQELEADLSALSTRKLEVVEGPKCNSSDLNEELGQVEVLFSDKTGTLTENKMLFKACSIHGQLYRSINQRLFLQPPELFNSPIPNTVQKLSHMPVNRQSYLASNITMASAELKERASKVHGNKHVKEDSKPFDHRTIPALSRLTFVEKARTHEEVVEFFTCLCLCSTITVNETLQLEDCLPDKTGNEYDYQSASPDEESLILAAHQLGITLCKSNDRECFIVIGRTSSLKRVSSREPGHFRAIVEGKKSTDKFVVRHFERRLVFEFNSIRKRMSVIYYDCDNDCLLMVCKGSEELLDCVKLNNLSERLIKQANLTLAHFEAFAKSGLRTLLVAKRQIQRDEYEQIMRGMKEARLSINNRDHMLNRVYQRAEQNFDLIGTTAVEDSLQEGVPETIENLKKAGIKVWLLTGDKVETATSVAHLCKLLDNEMLLFHLVRQQDVQACKRLLIKFNQQLKKAKKEVQQSGTNHEGSVENSAGKSLKITAQTRFSLVADGRSLHYAMKYAKEELASLCFQCTCVLGCRLSPLQKAEVVSMIKQGESKPVTAAIGDGANDVSMIQEADVGIGICGKEGRQAVNSSDFAINRFRMLNRLLFVHGHLFYHRTANTIHYFFYKNILFVLPQFIYSFYNLSSALSLYHPFLMISYNLFFTSLPILIYGLFEVHIPKKILELYPQLYRDNRHSSQLQLSVFLSWILLGTCQALICFHILYFVWGSHTPFLESGKMAGINGFSIILYFAVILTATFRLYFISKSHSLCFNLSTVSSYALMPIFFTVYSLINWYPLMKDNTLYGQFIAYLKSPMFWLAIITATTATILPDIGWYIKQRIDYFNHLSTVLHEHNREIKDEQPKQG